MKQIIILSFSIIALSVNAQQLKKGINQDSLFKTSIKDLPQDLQDTLQKEFISSDEKNREFLLFVVTMPRSSKKLMIKNIDSNFSNVEHLKLEYSKLVPHNYKVRIEFEPANPSFGVNENINLRIMSEGKDDYNVKQDWHLEYNSEKLTKMLKIINWDSETLKKIKSMLHQANCISIENGDTAEIGFARSGLGEYSYLIFSHDLSKDEAKSYNNRCYYIFYKRNIVLKYDGGAAGPQCFPDR